MGTFQDRDRQAWTITLDIGCVMRLKKNTRFDLFSPSSGTPQLMTVLLSDLPEFWELLWHLIESQAIERGISAEQFGMSMLADNLIAAREAFIEEWRDFFRRLQQMENVLLLEKAVEYLRAAKELVSKQMSTETIKAMDAAVMSKMQSELSRRFSELRESLA